MFTPEVINTGTLPNDGQGDPLRVAFQKINNNFSNLAYTATTTSTSYTDGDTPNQVILEIPVDTFTQGLFQIKSFNQDTADTQNIVISSQIKNDNSGVKFTAYGTTFDGDPVCTYDMDVDSEKVRILVIPLVDATLTHFVAAQVTHVDALLSSPSSVDGYENIQMLNQSGLLTTAGQ